jgi:uncharacterized protein YndB with AHSA1/START domain
MSAARETDSTTRQAIISLPSERETVITRVFDAPAQLVFEAMTNCQHLKRWYGLRANTMTVCEIDLRPGGAWRWVQTAPDGQEVAFSGVYREIDAPHRMVSTEEYEAMPGTGYVVTVTLDEQDGETTLTSHLLYQSQEHRDGHLQSGMEWGMNETYQRLDELLATLR